MSPVAVDLRALVLDHGAPTTLVFPADQTEGRPAALSAPWRDRFSPGGRGPAVAAILTNDAPSTGLLLGAIEARSRVVSLPLPARGADPGGYLAFIRAALRATGAPEVIARSDIARLLASAGIEARSHDDAMTGPPLADVGPGFELVQFTSGSTGPPKPLLVDEDVLVTNIAAILRRVVPRPGDHTVSWLPLSHDMGLIGMLLTSLAAVDPSWPTDTSIVVLPPEQFLRSPARWMDAVDHWGATFTAAPDFGYRLATRGARRGLDLRRLRTAIVGGDIVRPSTLEAFDEAFRPLGLAPEALAPAYGLAELGLAASITPVEDRWKRVSVDGVDGVDGVDVAASGTPLDGYRVEITSDGQVAIAAPAIARPLSGAALPAAFGQPWVTGDLGHLTDHGDLVVTGRVDDLLVINGRNVHAPTIEAAAASVPNTREGRVIACGLPDGTWLLAVELARGATGSDQPAMQRSLRRACVSAAGLAPDHVAVVAPGALPFTTSGKARRHELRRRFLDGTIAPAG
jgi:fatty-acyl-CoA synthase